MTAVVIAEADDRLATRHLARCLVSRLRRVGARVEHCHGAGTSTARVTRVSGAIGDLDSRVERPVLVLFGNEGAQRGLLWGVALAGLLARARLVVHAGAARLPYEPSMADVFTRCDVVVAESQLGAQAVRQCCDEAGEPIPQIVVFPTAFPSATSLPGPTAADRRALRRTRMGADDDAVVVGCWTDNEPEEVAPLALRIFQMFARGHYWRCDDCGHLTPWSEDDQLRPVPFDHCARCGSASGAAGRARDDTRLLLVGEPVSDDGLWRTGAIATHLQVGDRVVHEPMPTSNHDLAQLWGGVDVHLQPHVLADVPASMRASCVLGVPIVATGHGAVAERLADAASLVTPRTVLDHSAGHRIALLDPGEAVTQLCRLADDRAARRLARARVRELARGWDTDTVLDRWIALLAVRVTS